MVNLESTGGLNLADFRDDKEKSSVEITIMALATLSSVCWFISVIKMNYWIKITVYHILGKKNIIAISCPDVRRREVFRLSYFL
jgi:hypothetical protein